MSSGGARARSGPAPDPNALRRDRPSDTAGWRDLPGTGRSGVPPAWPLGGRTTTRERELWAAIWARPEAIVWQETGAELEVALHVRTFARAERSTAPTSLLSEARIQADALGYTDAGRAKKRWRIVTEAALDGDRQPAARPQRTSKADIVRLVRPA